MAGLPLYVPCRKYITSPPIPAPPMLLDTARAVAAMSSFGSWLPTCRASLSTSSSTELDMNTGTSFASVAFVRFCGVSLASLASFIFLGDVVTLMSPTENKRDSGRYASLVETSFGVNRVKKNVG